MKRVIALFLSLSFIFALVPAMTLSVSATNDPLCFEANVAGSTVKLVNNGGGSGSAEYSTNGTSWYPYIFTDTDTITITLTNAGDKVYFRGTDVCGVRNLGFMGINPYYQFVMTGSITASGNLNSLINYLTDITTDYCFYRLFFQCDALTNAKDLELPAQSLSKNCYAGMFEYCTSLTDAPKLPAKTLAESCYASMFNHCESLKEIPKLEAMNLADRCYSYMFHYCTSLVSIPTLPATALKEKCYEAMFMECTSLKNPPVLPAMSLTDSCYSYMFYKCTELESTPKLPATTLANYCYYFMFYECTSLIYATTLPASNLARECYENMFQNCSLLMIVTDTNGYYGYDGIWNFSDNGSFDPLYGMIKGTKNTSLLSQLSNGTLLTGTNYYFKLSSYCLEQTEEIIDLEADPETDIKIGDKTYTFRYSNETVVVNENYENDITESNNIFFDVDYSEANADIDTIILPNKVVKLVNEANKGIKFTSKVAYAILDRPIVDANNSIRLELSEGCATYLQKKAMNGEVIAEVKYTCTSNAKAIDNDATIYVPCDSKTAKVFYIIDANTIGTLPCEVVDGYCVFDRYQDGTYVVVK